MTKMIFLNLPVKNLERSKTFYTALGYTINPEFTDEKAACVVVSDTIYVMILLESFFQTFIKKEISDASRQTETLIALTMESREEVDRIFEKAIAAGGKTSREPEDYGWMYGRAVEDPDGHILEFFYQDLSKKPKFS